MATEFVIKHPATAAMMKAANGEDAADVAQAAATILAQCCLCGNETVADAYAELELHVAAIKEQITLNLDHPKFPVTQ